MLSPLLIIEPSLLTGISVPLLALDLNDLYSALTITWEVPASLGTYTYSLSVVKAILSKLPELFLTYIPKPIPPRVLLL